MATSAYPWAKTPLLASAPMLNIAKAPLAVAVSSAGALGFLAAGYELSDLDHSLHEARLLMTQSSNRHLQSFHAETGLLPIGVGFINWGADLDTALAAIQRYKPCAVWLFAPSTQPDDLRPWVYRIRAVSTQKIKIWVQVGTVTEASAVADALSPDVLVVQGCDAGGHGLVRSASVITLVPEIKDMLRARSLDQQISVLAAGGIVDGRGLAAVLALGASGAAMGTRFLAADEANIARGYQDRILASSDGGISTVRSTVYDRVRGIYGWPQRYDGRGVINKSYIDAVSMDMSDEENKRLYEEELKKGDSGWAPEGRLTTYAGTGVGLVKEVLSAADIVRGVLTEAQSALASAA